VGASPALKTHRLKLVCRVFSLFAALVLSWGAQADTLFSNLGHAPNDMETWKTADRRFATDFLTGDSATLVTGISMPLFNSSPDTHGFTASIFTDFAGAPGRVLVGAFSLSVPAGELGTNQTFGVSSGLSLAANTPYWVVVQIDQDITVPGNAGWREDYNGQATDPGTPFTTIAATDVKTSADNGATYVDFFPGNYHFSLTGSIPEPNGAALLSIGCLVGAARRPRKRS
jgi:hypothetical protein